MIRVRMEMGMRKLKNGYEVGMKDGYGGVCMMGLKENGYEGMWWKGNGFGMHEV